MVMREMNSERQTYLLARGAYDAPTEPVDPDTPDALPPFPAAQPKNRLGLARWLTNPQHPLTARVAVNQLWQLCFGEGLVRTTEDFGSQGEVPTHPALLDWLASDFVGHGWDVKRLMKQIVLSSTYRQSSDMRAELEQIDPEESSSGTRQQLPVAGGDDSRQRPECQRFARRENWGGAGVALRVDRVVQSPRSSQRGRNSTAEVSTRFGRGLVQHR